MTKTIRHANHTTDNLSTQTETAPIDPGAPSATVDLTVSTDPRQQAAYDAIAPAARALDRQSLLPVNLDPPTVVSTCLAVADQVKPRRATIAAMPGFDIEALDQLETTALALEAAQGHYNTATTPPDALADLIDHGIRLRRTFAVASAALADAGVVDPNRFDSLPTGNAYRDIATALGSYVVGFRRDHWETAKTKSALTDAMLAEAESLSTRILAIVGMRELSPAKVAEAADMRQRVFTLCVLRYDQVRRAVTYMQWDAGDADEIAPSLYLKGPRKAAPHPAAPVAPSAPSATPASATPAVAPAHVTAGAVGTPSSSPFTAS
ncbi:MAG: hypothetical protein WCJ30_01690 [Deltaproteobacteria bacterium]